jgi:hypothetical protein
MFECGTTFELVTFLHIRQTCLGFVDFRYNLLSLMESREELHMGKSRVNVIMTLLPFSRLERERERERETLDCYRRHCT